MSRESKLRITNLWKEIQQHPTEPILWSKINIEYKKARLREQENYTSVQLARLTNQKSATRGQEPDKANQYLSGPITDECTPWEKALAEWVGECEGDWLSCLYLSRLLDRNKNSDQQHQLLNQCLQSEPIPGETMHWIGVWRLNSGDHTGAIEALSQLVDVRPLRHGSMLYLGEALLKAGNTKAAEVAFTRASTSQNPNFLRMMAERVSNNNYWQEAIEILELSLKLDEDNVQSLQLLAEIHWDSYQLEEAEKVFNRILQLDPQNRDVRYKINALPGRRGDARAHLALVEKHYAEAQDPQSRLASSVAMTSLYVDNRTPEAIAELHQKLCSAISRNIEAKTNFENNKDENRVLCIGLVTGDFHRQHPINLFMLPLLERINKEKFKVIVFYTGAMHDTYTARAQTASSRWIECGNIDDALLQQRIISENVDILIDLAGHTSNHRLGVFALRSAPVQATFLGYPHSTGLDQMDWIIGDSVVAPIEHAHLFSENIAQLDGSVFCWSPIDDYPLPKQRSTDAGIVFGSFNNVMKLTPYTIQIWASILKAHPNSQLLLKAPSLRDQSVIERFKGIFRNEGIQDEQLEFEGPTGLEHMMQRYGDVDIALDPTPYNGGTTTLQAMWMGVPVITLEGKNFVSRMGSSFLQAAGYQDWIARNPEEYLAIATAMVADIQNIRQSRESLRKNMVDSRLSNPGKYSQNFEDLLQRMWRHYCNNNSEQHLIAIN